MGKPSQKSQTKGSGTVYIDTPIQYLKGVGPHLAKVFQRRGITTFGDLLEWYPRAYQDRRAAVSIRSLKEEEVVSLKAHIVGVRSIPLGKSKRRIWEVVVRDESGMIRCKYFRTPYKGYFERFTAGDAVRVEGKVTNYRGSLEFHHPDIRDLKAEEDLGDQIVPLYTETEGLSPARLQKIIKSSIDLAKGNIPETLPAWIVKKYDLVERERAYRGLHQPTVESYSGLSTGTSPFHKRIKFEEFFWMQMILMARRSKVIQQKSEILKKDPEEILLPVLGRLGFELTDDQQKTLTEILSDLRKGTPMHRMVQGDVGSGKTAVAFLSAAYVMAHGHQCALMAPTEILA
ncbi:MAG: ATP-dependent DNA helicase RecG, partial [Bdellovibrionales bacterium]|nr:ATP-dependent DNA helicase RecG [Bdellovibrionales bacterium]